MPVTTSTTSQNLSTQQAKFVHPTFQVLQPVWQMLRDVREGIGGFLNGDYLIGHPREYITHTVKRNVTASDGTVTEVKEVVTTKRPTKKFQKRKDLSSYENFAGTIIEALKTAICREQPIRRVGDPTKPAAARPKKTTKAKAAPKPDAKPDSPIELWWDNVDGAGTHIDDFMAMAWDIAATFGHVFVYLDRQPADAPSTAADQAMPYLRVYTPLDVWDWLCDDMGELTAVKFAELTPRVNLEEAWRPQVRVRIVDDKEWKVYDQKGVLIDSGPHQMGKLPVVVLFSTRRPLEPQVGAAVLGDPKLYVDLYNLVSEVRELLRNQTFGILNVPLGTGPDAMNVTEAQAMMGNSTGTENVLFSGTAADYISPSSENVTVYHEEIARKLRTIYRLVSLTWEADSKDAEAEGSLKIKREEMNERLSGYADELEKADYKLACLFYRAMEGADSGEQKLENDDVQIKYPDNFDLTPFEKVLEQAQAAMNLGMPALFLKEMRKHLARKFEGFADAPQSVLDAIDEAIDAAPDDLTPAEQAKQRLELTVAAMKTGGKGEPQPPKPPMKDKAAA